MHACTHTHIHTHTHTHTCTHTDTHTHTHTHTLINETEQTAETLILVTLGKMFVNKKNASCEQANFKIILSQKASTLFQI